MKKRIYLIMLYKSAKIKVPPFALMYLSYSLKKAGYDPKVIHCTPLEMERYADEIIDTMPFLVGFSVLSGPPTLYSLQMSRLLKSKSPSLHITWGGVHPSLLPEQCLKEEYIDSVVIGEGEETIVKLADAISGKKPIKGVLGIGYKQNGKVTINPPRPFIKHLDKCQLDFKSVNLDDYVTECISKENRKIRNIGYYSSRGCPFNCGFCYNQIFHQRKWRAQSIEHVVKDILYLKKKYRINEIRFWDDNFFANPKRAIEILQKIDMFSGLEIRIDCINQELAKKLKELKVSYLVIGIESGSDRILKLIEKNFDKHRIMEGVGYIAQNKLKAQYSFILGLPTETKTELYDTINLMLAIKKKHKDASFTVGSYLPYPKTRLFNLAIKKGFKPPAKTEGWYFIDRWENTVNLPWINKKVCLNTRHLFVMMDWGKLIRLWAELRLRKKWLTFGQDLRFLIILNTLKNRCQNGLF